MNIMNMMMQSSLDLARVREKYPVEKKITMRAWYAATRLGNFPGRCFRKKYVSDTSYYIVAKTETRNWIRGMDEKYDIHSNADAREALE